MEQKQKRSKRYLWSLVFLALVAVTIYVVTQQGFTLAEFGHYLMTASPWWLLIAGVCMVGFVFFEGYSISYLCRFFGAKCPKRKGFVYAASDIYFSAITPSATGGQPAAAFCMMRDGIPAAATTMALLLNLMMYNVSLIVLAVFCFTACPAAYLNFEPLGRVLIWIGIGVQAFMALLFFLLVFRASLVMSIANFGLKLLSKLHLVRRVDEKRESLSKMAVEYKECIDAVWHHGGVICKTFLLNFCQRLSLLGVTLCVYLAQGGSPADLIQVAVIQSFAVLGSNSIPIPGAVGVADYLFINGFQTLLGSEAVLNMELLSRGISFYVCLLLCGLTVLINYGLYALRKKRKE